MPHLVSENQFLLYVSLCDLQYILSEGMSSHIVTITDHVSVFSIRYAYIDIMSKI